MQWYAVVLVAVVYVELRILISFDQQGLAYLIEGETPNTRVLEMRSCLGIEQKKAFVCQPGLVCMSRQMQFCVMPG